MKVSFADVAGVDEASKSEGVVEFLRTQEVHDAGGRIRKGFCGRAAGYRKTLLVAPGRRARCPFQLSGSEFWRWSSVSAPPGPRSLLPQAEQKAPASSSRRADALGRARVQSPGIARRKRTDAEPAARRNGRFDSRKAIIIMAATNRRGARPALLRLAVRRQVLVTSRTSTAARRSFA